LLKGTRRYWLVAIICGCIASLLFYNYLQDIKERYKPDDLVQVVKARTDIPRDTIVLAEQLTVVQIPGRYVHPNAIKERNEAAGKIALSDITAGQELLASHLLTPGEKSDRTAYSVPGAKRAISIEVDKVSGVSGGIQPGDRVDIMATVNIPVLDAKGNEKEEPYTLLTLQDIEVLKVDGVATGSNQSDKKTLTLLVSPQEAQPLVLASEKGRLRLLLRSPVDKSRADIKPMTLTDFLK
jgi:pilus assembly protein CpaB